MSLMKTLTKVAIGVAVAKGASAMMKKSGQSPQRGQVSDDGLFGGAYSPGATTASSSGGIEDLLGAVLGGQSSSGASGGGLGGLLEQLAGGGASSRSGGMDDLLGGLSQASQRGGGSSGGGLGDLLGGLMGAAAGASTGANPTGNTRRDTGNAGFGEKLNQAFKNKGEPDTPPTPEQDLAAGLLLRAMIQAAKSDGKIDAGEKQKLLDKLGDVSAAERDFVNAELAAPVDVKGLAGQVPRGLEQQVYMMSVLGIDLDSQQEARYLHELASALGVGQAQVNAIHDHLGVPKIYG